MYTYVVADDEMLTRKGVIKKLEDLEDKLTCVGEAENGMEALTLIEQVLPDIVITDMQMPISGGTELLEALKKNYPKILVIVISGFKDFDYAKSAIQANAISYILKPFGRKEIQDAVSQAMELLESSKSSENRMTLLQEEEKKMKYNYDLQMINNIILGYNTSNFEITSEQLKIEEQIHKLYLLTIYSTEIIQHDKISNYALSNVYGDLSIYLPHQSNDYIGFIILFFPKQLPPNINSILSKISEALISLMKGNKSTISIGISSPKDSFVQLGEAYQETINALNRRKLMDRDHTYFFTTNDLPLLPVVWEKEELFLFRIESGELKELSPLIDDLFETVSAMKEGTLFDTKVYCTDLCQKAKFLYNQYYDINTNQESSSSTQRIFNSIFEYNELKVYLCRFFINISSGMKVKSVYSVDDFVEAMKIYIIRNYRNNITIEFLSSLFYLNKNYCSHAFKKKAGISFADYLAQTRITRACYLLTETDQKIYQIAKSVGYNNMKYFFRVFKKVTGKTPEQYRIKNKKV